MKYYKGNFPDPAAFGMAAYGWAWHTEVGLHVIRLVSTGLFDRYPKFKIVIGHMGEMLPFQLDHVIESSRPWVKLQKGLKEVWDENIWITTSGMFSWIGNEEQYKKIAYENAENLLGLKA
ncbi:hypothetical protein MMC18_007407 [Xylographa bjoerkii]|nr:hypothetical protein [Xylographa bjoerkii]